MLQLEKIDALIDNKRAEKELWWCRATSTTSVLTADKVQSSSSQQKMADAALVHLDKGAEVDELLAKLEATRQEIIRTIEELNATEYNLLHKVYVQKWSLKEFAAQQRQSYSWATTVHGRALQHLQKILNERDNDDG